MPKGSKVLMADDDKMLIDMYKERLELAGYTVEIGRNGEEALAKIHDFQPDIVMLDVMMPKLNGYETLASIKSDPQTKDIPVIMLSALMRDFNREKAVESGADDYLIKSEAMPADVITKIEQVLQKYGKGSTTVPGTTASNIQAPSATPPSAQKKTEEPNVIFKAAPAAGMPTHESAPVPAANPVPSPSEPSPMTEPPKKEKSPISVAMIITLTILITTLITSVIIYYFFIMKK